MKKTKLVIEKSFSKEGKVFTKFNVSPDLKCCFRSFEIYTDYGENIKADESILNIPAISSILTLIWLAGGDIYVDKLDKQFYHSMNTLQKEFAKMPYRKIPFNTKIHAKNLVENTTGEEGTALFFSGGLDSTYSLYKNIEKKPWLLMVLGFDVWRTNSLNEKIWAEWRDVYTRFAKQEGLKISFIRTNTREVMDEGQVQRRFNGMFPGIYWTALRHSPMLLGLGAPFSIGRFNELIIAATRDISRPPATHAFCSQPETDEVFNWADLHVKHSGYITRQEKMSYIKDKLERGRVFGFRPCWHPVMGLNCNRCEKCYRTIVALVLEGIDPNICGLKVNPKIFGDIKNFIMGVSKPALRDGSNVYQGYWYPMKHSIPSEVVEDIHGSKEFLEWLRAYKL